MKMQNVSLADIEPNPWRDTKLYPIDKDHVTELRDSINDHGFFGGVKGRRRNGKIELGCGHARIEAARKAKLDSVPIFIDDLDDDQMLRLMTDENATQAGANPGAVINEVAAVTRRLIEGLLEGRSGTIVPDPVRKAFDDKHAINTAQGKLEKRLTNPDADLPIGHVVIRTYLGQGNPERSHRAERQIREAISALKQSGRYDEIIDEMLRKYPQPVDGKESKSRAVERTKSPARRKPILDERTANMFPNEHQFQAFREAVTSPTAQKFIPVKEQYALAKEIMSAREEDDNDDRKVNWAKKQVGAPSIKKHVQHYVEQAAKEQRNIDKEEREQYLREQREARIDDELHSAKASLRSLISAMARLIELADEFPAHPKLGGFSAKLDQLIPVINQFSKKLK